MAEVAQDYEGVRVAMRELLEEWLEDSIAIPIASSLEHAANAEALLASTLQRTLSPGYYDWAQHLLHLDRYRIGGIQLTFKDVTEEEAQGLAIVAEERKRFQDLHPACAKCGAMNKPFANACRSCNEALRAAAQEQKRSA